MKYTTDEPPPPAVMVSHGPVGWTVRWSHPAAGRRQLRPPAIKMGNHEFLFQRVTVDNCALTQHDGEEEE